MNYLLTALLLALPLVVGAYVVWVGMGKPTRSEFWDRPVCWITGNHDLTHALWRTTVELRGRAYPAVVWRCSRHPSTLVTVVGGGVNGDA